MAKAYATFSDIQKDLQTGRLTCEDLVKQHLSAIQAQASLNAFISVYAEEALERAQQIDRKIKDRSAGKLAGLVVGLKDVYSHKGHSLQAASRILDGFIAQYSATVVERLLAADAIIIGRQNCDEFAMGSSTENSAFGAVRNPVDPSRVAGGSSGGSAVAVACGMCRISIGSDTGGSVRQPAAFCGVIGLKPTYSRISRHGLVAYGSSFDCVGIVGSAVEDVALVLETIAGADDHDSTVSRLPVPAYLAELSGAQNTKYRIAYIRSALDAEGLQPEIRENIMGRIEALRDAGHTAEAIDFPLNDFVLPTYYILATAEASSNLSRYDGVRYGYRTPAPADLHALYKKTRTEGFGQEVQRRILLGTFVLSANYYDTYYSRAQKVRRLIRDAFKQMFESYDCIIMPVAPTTAFKLGSRTNDPLQMYLADLYSVQANVAGIPAISVPCGTDREGLPVGIQIITDDFHELKLMGLSEILLNLN